jgi:hypothetical protein
MYMKINSFKILFIHGYTASSQADFYPFLSQELDKRGIDYVIPDLPGGDKPHTKIWLKTIHEALQENTKPLIIVGHSLGTRAALLYVEKYNIDVERLFLIAAFANRLENAKRKEGLYLDFFDHIIDIPRIKTYIEKAFVLHSIDDHSIPFAQGEEIARDIKAELIVSENRCYFSNPSNAPYIFSVLKEKIGF